MQVRQAAQRAQDTSCSTALLPLLRALGAVGSGVLGGVRGEGELLGGLRCSGGWGAFAPTLAAPLVLRANPLLED
eukprot:162221-Alexandrium_andersonii.AAC.1